MLLLSEDDMSALGTILTFSNGQKIVVDITPEKMLKFIGAKENLD